MALSAADKKWFRKMFKDEIATLLEDMVASAQHGGYDGATPVVDDDDTESRIGFHAIGRVTQA